MTGLQLLPNFITPEAAFVLTGQVEAQLDAQPVETSTTKEDRNRVARLGFNYYPPHDWRNLPAWLLLLSLAVQKESKSLLNSYTLNEYLPGQGIAPHTDTVHGFGNIIAVLSLGSHAKTLWHPPNGGRPIESNTPKNSLTIFSGDLRRDWRHSVPAVTEKRLSIVFRHKLT